MRPLQDAGRGWRHVTVSQQRTRVDFAHCVKELVDTLYPDAGRIVLVCDQLTPHATASLYATLPPHESRRKAERLEWHHTSKHGSWLNIAARELSVLARQCVAQRLPDRATRGRTVSAWTDRRNAIISIIDWHVTMADTRIDRTPAALPGVLRLTNHQVPVAPSMLSRSKSAWPTWRAVSWTMCIRIQRRVTPSRWGGVRAAMSSGPCA